MPAKLEFVSISHSYGLPGHVRRLPRHKAGAAPDTATRQSRPAAGLTAAHRFGSADQPPLALDNVSLRLESGDSLALIGPSGCGKSSLLLMAAGLVSPTQGQVLVDGQPVQGPRQKTALILQNLGLLPWKTVSDNVGLGLQLRGVNAQERARRVGQALEQVGLADQAQHYPAQLSGGMRQRVALARSLALDCDLLLLDEPLSAVDELLRERLQDSLLELWQARRHTQILVTHSIEEGVFLGRHIAVMSPSPGQVLALIDNPGMGSPGWRTSDAAFELARNIRQTLRAGLRTKVPAETPEAVATPETGDTPEAAGTPEVLPHA